MTESGMTPPEGSGMVEDAGAGDDSNIDVKGGYAHGEEVAPDTLHVEELHDGHPHTSASADENPAPEETPDEELPGDVFSSLGVQDPSTDETDQLARAMESLYGPSFPLLGGDSAEDSDRWVTWGKQLWEIHGPGVRQVLHTVEGNRLFRKGVQWISSIGFSPWREPPKPRDATRAVDNVIAPALDQRLQIITEQKPGFRTKPESQDRQAMKRAEAQQQALEHQYDVQKMQAVQREAAFWAGTDGVSFGHCYWHPDKGPRGQDGRPQGDCCTKVQRIEQVRVSSDASSTHAPSYWIIRETIPTQQAVSEHGAQVVKGFAGQKGEDQTFDTSGQLLPGSGFSGLGTVPDSLLEAMPTVDRYTIYCDKSNILPEGLTLVIVGDALVAGPLPLIYGIVPVFVCSDGSTDPAFYKEAVMTGWKDSQMRINALKSKWIDSIRLNAGGRLLGRPNAISTETLYGGLLSVIEVKGQGPIGDTVQPFEGFSVGTDTETLLEIEKKAFEDRSGWNDISRGQFGNDQSGRAILATRETLERIFAPPVNAMAEAMTKWGEITIRIMQWGYDYPRQIAVQGKGRPDLARVISSQDLSGAVSVTIDPETLMPMPRSLRLFLLNQMKMDGTIDNNEYRRRMPFASVQNLDTPDNDQYNRAQRVVQAIRETGNPNALPLLWQDNEAIHQDVLERELIFVDDPTEVPPQVRQAALARWQMLAMQSASKMAPPPPPAGSPGVGGHPPPRGPAVPSSPRRSEPTIPPGQMPFAQQNPSIAAGSASQMADHVPVAA